MNNIAEIAAQWWADKLKEKAHHDNGSRDFVSMLTGLIADDQMEEISDKRYKTFKEQLETEITRQRKEYRGTLYIGCDYSPCAILLKCAEKAEISEMNFPWKTSMYIQDDKVMVIDGYGAEPKEVL